MSDIIELMLFLAFHRVQDSVLIPIEAGREKVQSRGYTAYLQIYKWELQLALFLI